ncbi:BTAD domain-containing putative transcriptional regulator [Micromonospora sp. NPDC049559]|uniref:BTAD domain-containing putative transcriptional regulator n=1 Tax=Micromonospora sp. NPDC049559 TaxID=3155923 RepID=UPI00341C4528
MSLLDPSGPHPSYRQSQGLVRPRLLAMLNARPAAPTLVVAPAGWGKTTLLAQYANSLDLAVGWLRIESSDANPDRLLRRMHVAVQAGLPDAGAVAAGGPSASVPRSLLVIDDLHLIEGSPAESTLLDRSLDLARRDVKVVIGTRRMPNFDLSRHELSDVDVIDAEQLRFRAWEVERLLRDVYREPLPADDVAALSRRVGGWAAGLKLYHLSTRGHSLAERRRAVAALGGRSALSRGYLARTVLAELPEPLRLFLARTCVFETPTGPRCDQLLGATDSQFLLEQLEHRQAFTITHDGGRTFRYHEVLRAHLVAGLVEELGEGGARAWHARAGEILAEEGALLEATRCYARAEDWGAVHRLLDEAGASVADQGLDSWTDLLPGWFIAEDPWLVLAEGRHRVNQGQLETGAVALQRAEEMFTAEPARVRSRALRTMVLAWLPDSAPWRGHWTGWLRAATRRHPAVVAGEAESLPPAVAPLVRAIAYLLAGNIEEAGRILPRVSEDDSDFAGLAGRLLQAAHAMVGGDRWGDGAVAAVASAAESRQLPWLARMARAVMALDGTEPSIKEAAAVAEECDRLGDTWGAFIASGLAQLMRSLHGRIDPDEAGELLARARALESGVLAAWAQSLLALATVQARLPEAELEVRRAESTARAAGVPGARVLALAAAAQLGPRQAEQLAAAYAAATHAGLPRALVAAWTAGHETAQGPSGPSPDARIAVWCLGGFRMRVDGRVLDWSSIRPRSRTVARILAMTPGRPIHRDKLVEALWPDADPATATRRLHVALSTLRRFFEENLPAEYADRLLYRDGDAYLLAVPDEGYCDVAVLRDALERARRAHPADPGYLDALRTAVHSYGGDLLPEDGPAEWVVNERETLRRQAADAAARLAQAELDGLSGYEQASGAAVAMARRCVEIDPWHDAGWRLLIAAHGRAGNAAAAERARREYAEVLVSLGLDPAASVEPAEAMTLISGQRIPLPRSPRSGSTAAARTPSARQA